MDAAQARQRRQRNTPFARRQVPLAQRPRRTKHYQETTVPKHVPLGCACGQGNPSLPPHASKLVPDCSQKPLTLVLAHEVDELRRVGRHNHLVMLSLDEALRTAREQTTSAATVAAWSCMPPPAQTHVAGAQRRPTAPVRVALLDGQRKELFSRRRAGHDAQQCSSFTPPFLSSVPGEVPHLVDALVKELKQRVVEAVNVEQGHRLLVEAKLLPARTRAPWRPNAAGPAACCAPAAKATRRHWPRTR